MKPNRNNGGGFDLAGHISRDMDLLHAETVGTIRIAINETDTLARLVKALTEQGQKHNVSVNGNEWIVETVK